RTEEALRSLNIYLAHRPQDEKALDLLRDLGTPEAAPPAETATVQEEILEPAVVGAPEPPALKPVEPLAFEEEEKPEFGLEEEVLHEIATPTLAEVYVNQGEIQEALSVYEKVVARNPEDQASMTRIEELRTMLTVEPPLAEEAVSGAKQRKEKTIAILESWLASIRKMSENTVSA
ncbi:MAG: hypothetical protein NTY44_10225, partial [Deltaproteobacteria bacterium]|nr:hypothetical protein [Deltaproteobacteria bacterium]